MAKHQERSPELVAIHERVRFAFKAYRESRGWSQKDMADFLHISQENYKKYESHPERGIPIDIIARFCRYTDTDANYLFYGRRTTGPRKV